MRFILFMLGVLLSLLVSIRIDSPEVLGFDRFKVRTTQQNLEIGHHEFVPSAKVDTTAVAVALANIRAGNGSYHASSEFADVFRLIQTSRALIGVDILDILKWTPPENKARFDAHMRYVATTIEQSAKTIELLEASAQARLLEASACLDKKQAGDQLFFQGVETKKDIDAQVGLSQSLQYAPCYITKRIEANASTYLANQLAFTLAILRQRHALLTANADALINYHGILEGDVLEQLVVLKQQLTSVQVADPTKSSSVFDLFLFDANTKLPTFNRALYSENKIPSFQNPGVELHTP